MFTDINMSDHINNVIYFEWILEALPKEHMAGEAC
jgi:acyl-ACP thioesterase